MNNLKQNNAQFAVDVPMKEIKKRIIELLNTKQVQELDLLLQELYRRKLALRSRILMEMTDFGRS